MNAPTTPTTPSNGATKAAEIIYDWDNGQLVPTTAWIAEIIERETGAAKLADALKDVTSWIDNWSPSFADDPEWEATQSAARAALNACCAATAPEAASDFGQEENRGS